MNLKDLEYRYGLSKGMITLIVVVCSFVLWCLDSVLLLFPRGMRGGKKRVLVIKLDAIGDFIIWLDFARGLRELFPASTTEIILVANEAWKELAKQTNAFDEVIGADRMTFLLNPIYRFRKLLRVRRMNADIVVDPVFSREFNLSPAFVRTCGAESRIGSIGDSSNQRPWQKRLSDTWYTRLLPAAKEQRMELVRNAEYLRQLGNPCFKARMPRLPCSPSPDTVPYYILFPGAGWVNRQWPAENFAAIASRVYRATGMKGVICGGGADAKLSERIRSLADVPLEDMTGRTTLSELAFLIAGARFLVGNETSAIHLAAAVSTPAVCILGGGHFGRFVPYQLEEDADTPTPVAVFHQMDCYYCNWHCIYPITGEQPVPCVASVSVDAVWEAVDANHHPSA